MKRATKNAINHAFDANPADFAAYAAVFAITPEIYEAVRAVSNATTATINQTDDSMWSNITADINILETSKDKTQANLKLLACPLWLVSFPNTVQKRWLDVRRELANSKEGWDIWERWYDRRLDGKSTDFDLPSDADEALVKKIATQKNVFWYREPARINAEIKAWLADLTPPVSQDANSLRFRTGDDHRIQFAPINADDRLNPTPQLFDKYFEFKKSFDRLKLCSPNELGDELPELLVDLGETFPPQMDDINVHLFWPRFNRLRKLLKRHQVAVTTPDMAHDRLNGSVPTRLEEVVENGNIFIFGQPQFTDKDTEALGPLEKSAVIAAYAQVQSIIAITASDEDITEKTTGKEVAKAIRDGNDIWQEPVAALGQQQGHRIQKNFLIEMVNKFMEDTKPIRKGFLEGMGVVVGEEFIRFMLANEDSILEFFAAQAPEYIHTVKNLFDVIAPHFL